MAKHILVISQYFYPEQFRINDICTELVKQGFKVTVLTGIPNYPQGRFYEGYGWNCRRRESWNGIDIIRIPLIPRGHGPIGMVLNYMSFVVSGYFWKVFTKLDPDWIFTFEVSPMTQALIGVWLAQKRNIPNYLYVQDLWPDNVEIVTGIHSPAVIRPIRKMVNHIYRHCDKILATSPSFVEEIRRYTPGEEEKVVYWPQYAESFYVPSTQKSDLIPQDGIPNITFTGNVGTAQGLEILPKTAVILKQRGIPIHFNIVGEGRNKEHLLAQIQQLEVQSYFNMIGWQAAETIPSILAASDAAFLSFANNELFSKTIPAKMQSYMACGCAVIGAVQGESERIIHESGCGLVAQIGNPDSLADIIAQFSASSASERQEMREASVLYCNTHFHKDTLMAELISQYFTTGEMNQEEISE